MVKAIFAVVVLFILILILWSVALVVPAVGNVSFVENEIWGKLSASNSNNGGGSIVDTAIGAVKSLFGF